MYLLVFAVVISTLLLVDYLYRRETNQKSANIPRRSYYCPFIGHLEVLSTCSLDGFLRLASKHFIHVGKTFAFWATNKFVVVSSDPKVLEAILNNSKHLGKPDMYDFLRPWLGDSLLLTIGDKWRRRRKMFSAVFHFSAYKDFNAVFEKQGSILVAQLKEQCGHGAFDATRCINAATIDIISEIGTGIDRKSQLTKDYRYADALNGVIEVASKRAENLLLMYDFFLRMYKPGLKAKQDAYFKTMRELTNQTIIQSRKALLERSAATGTISDSTDIREKRRLNLMEVLLQTTDNGKPYPDNDIREAIDALMFGGHDTVTLSMLFTMYRLSRHPNVQTEVFREIRSVIGDDPSASVSVQQLNELKYLEIVLKEVLRLHPPVTAIARLVKEDIHVGKYTIPARTIAIIPISLIQMDPVMFPNPRKFIPERFAVEDFVAKQQSYSFLAFSAGPRNCPGRKLALLEMKSIVSKVIRHYELLPMGEEPNIKACFMLYSANGVNLGIKTRVYD